MANKTTKMASRTQDKNARTLVGQRIRYIGDMTCPVCNTRKRRAMVSRHNETLYCNERCVLAAS